MPATFYDEANITDRVKRLEKLKAAMWQERTTYESHWRELGDYLLPRRTRFWTGDRNKGDRRSDKIIDSTARFSARTLQSGLHAGLTSPARPWFKLTTPDPDLAKFQPVKEWLHEVTQRMLAVFLQTNLYNVLPIVYGDMGVFGTACMALLEDSKDLFRCYPFPIGSYALGLDRRGVVSSFAREYELSVRQTVQEFGLEDDGRTIAWSRLSRRVRRLWDGGDYEQPVTINWMVTPNDGVRRDRLEARYLPWSSCYWELGASGPDSKLLRESGFRSFPIMGPRWDITGEDIYGTDCPGMTALGDVKQLQIMQRRKAQAINKMVDPALVGPSSLRTQKTSLLAGDITYEDVRDGMKGLRSIHDVTLRLDHLTADIGETQYRIQRAFFEDLFLMLARSDDMRGAQPITAREVEERHEEKLLALGPVLERTNDELLDPLVDRVYMLMDAAGMIPPPPSQLEGVDVKVEYTSIMAQAQKLVSVVGLDRFVQSVGVIAQSFPDAADKINIDQIVDNYGDTLGIDPRIIRTTDEAMQIRQQRAETQKAQADAETALKTAQAAKAAGETPMDGDTALSRLVGNAANIAAGPAGIQ